MQRAADATRSFWAQDDQHAGGGEGGEGLEDFFEGLQSGQGAVGKELRAAEAAAEQIGEGGVVLNAGDVPVGKGSGRLVREAPAVALGGVVGLVGGVEIGGDVPGDGLVEAEGLVMEEAVDSAAEQAHGGFEEDDGAAGGEDATKFAESGAGVLKVVPDVEEDESGD